LENRSQDRCTHEQLGEKETGDQKTAGENKPDQIGEKNQIRDGRSRTKRREEDSIASLIASP
jgi:hypothetical protein